MTHLPASLHIWSSDPLPAEVQKSIERLRQADDVLYVAVMPDAHLAQEVCVGAAIATTELIYPSAVGSDIGCGMATLAIHAGENLLSRERPAALLLSQLQQHVPWIRQLKKRDLPVLLEKGNLSDSRLDQLAQRDGRVQLGTLGRGNHFLEFQADEEGQLWVMLHSGSRAMGQAITHHHLRNCSRTSGGLSFLEAGTDAGRAYLQDVHWARAYAAENRLAMLRAVEAILQQEFSVEVDWNSLVQSDHDHVRRETHFGRELWVHRKGAQSAAEGEPGIVPGSMGTPSFQVTGRGCPESLMSCSHGAGRRLSRKAARHRVSVQQLERQLRNVWYDHRQSRDLCEEAPEAYKDVESVMRAQRDLVRIVRRLRPVLNYKGI